MAFQIRVECSNARLDAIETYGSTSCAMKVFTGTQPADCTAANSGTDLVTINLPSDWFNPAATRQITKKGTWSGTATAGSGATPGHFRIYNSQATMDGTTCFLQSGAGVGSGDLNFDGTITSGQTVTINTFTLTDGNA